MLDGNILRSVLPKERAFICVVLLSAFVFSGQGALADINRNGNSKILSADVLQLLNKAQQAMKAGHPEVAIIYLKNAEATAPDYVDTHMALGEALLAVGNPAEAMRELAIAKQHGVPPSRVVPLIFRALLSQRQGQLILNQYPAPADNDHSALAVETLLARGQAFSQAGNNADAATTLDKALAISRNTQTLIARAQLAMNTQDIPQASALVDEALKSNPGNANALLLRIALFQKASQPNNALPYASKLVNQTNGAPVALLARAGVYLQMHQDKPAEADVDVALKGSPGLSQAIFYKALLRARANDTNTAWELAQTLPREFLSSRPDIGIAMSQVAFKAGHKDIATDILHTTVHNFPDNVDARVRLVAAYIALNDWSNATLTLSGAGGSKDPRILALTAEVYAKKGDKQNATKYMTMAADQGFGGDELMLQEIGIEIRQGNYVKAQLELAQLNAKEPKRADIAGLLIDVFNHQGNYAASQQVADRFQVASPKSAFGPMFKAQIKVRQGDVDGAIALFSQAIALDPKSIPSLFGRSAMLSSEGKFGDALKDVQAALAIDPKAAVASVRAAQLQVQLGRPGDALQTLKRGLQTSPKDFELVSMLAQLYAQSKNFPAAEGVVTTYLNANPKDGRAITFLGNIQLGSGNKVAARATYSKLLQLDPKSPNAHLLLARAYGSDGDAKAANKEYDAAQSLSPNDPSVWLARIEYDISSNQNEAALHHAQGFAAAVPGPVSAQSLATVLARTGKLADAQKALENSIKKTPSNRSEIELSTILRAQGQNAEADKLLRSWLVQHPDDNDVKQALAVSLLDRDKEEAEKLLRQVVNAQPYNISALNNLAWILTEKDTKSALALANRAAGLEPNAPSVEDTLGWIKWHLHDKNGALVLLKQAQAGSPADPEINFHLASVLIDAGNSADGKKALSTALASKATFLDRKKAELLMANKSK